MRTLAIVLVAAVLAAGVVLYDMMRVEGKGERHAAAAHVRPVPDWLAALERHDPPLAVPVAPFQTADGGEQNLSDFAGKPVVVNLWATWCGPCVREMPSLARLQEAVESDGIRVLAVSSDRGGMNAVGPFMARHALSALTPYLDPTAKFTQSLPGRGLPRTYLIDAESRIVASYIGPAEWDAPDLVETIQEMAQ